MTKTEIEIFILPTGEVISPWWSEELKNLFCEICGKKRSKDCVTCMVTQPFCG